MPDTGKEIDIGTNIKLIEWLKVELISGVANVFKQLPKSREDVVASSLATVMLTCYLLGKRLGISFAKLECAIERKARINAAEGHEIEVWFNDLSTLVQHLESRRGK